MAHSLLVRRTTVTWLIQDFRKTDALLAIRKIAAMLFTQL